MPWLRTSLIGEIYRAKSLATREDKCHVNGDDSRSSDSDDSESYDTHLDDEIFFFGYCK